MLFCERLPHNLHDWLNAQVEAGTVDAACSMIERDLLSGVRFMNANGLLHFDVHFANVLTDGDRLHFADFGLAYVVTHLVNWLIVALTGRTDRPDRVAFIRSCADGNGDLASLPPAAVSIVTRYAPVTVVINDFYGRLFFESRAAPYPADDVRRVTRGVIPVPI